MSIDRDREPTMNRAGFTLIEVLVAMVLLGFALMGVQAVITDRLLGDVGRQDARATAHHLVDSRLQHIQTAPRYSQLAADFAGTDASIPDFPGFSRATIIQKEADYTVVTVEVITPTASDTVRGTTVIGIP